MIKGKAPLQNPISQLSLLPLGWVHVKLSHVLMIVIGGVELAEHFHNLKLCPTIPCSNHADSPAILSKAILTATTLERVCAIHSPGSIAKLLQVLGQSITDDSTCLRLEVNQSTLSTKKARRQLLTTLCRYSTTS